MANKTICVITDEVAVGLVTAGEVWVGFAELCPYELEFSVIVVEVSVDLKPFGLTHGEELTALPKTWIVI